jgi:hypothetical protein
MNKTDFSLAAMKENFKALFADKKQFVFECVRIGLIFFFFIWMWLPHFTFRETITSTVAHFNVDDFIGFGAFLATLLIIVWFVGLIFIYPLSLITSYKKYGMFILLGLGGIEFIYFFMLLIAFWVNLADVNDLNMATASLRVNIGFWFILLHIALVAVLALLPKPFKAITDKIVVAASKPKEAKPEAAPAPAEEPKVEPAPVEESKPEPVEEPKPKVFEEPQPEVTEEPIPEEKPAPKKTAKPKEKPAAEEPKPE